MPAVPGTPSTSSLSSLAAYGVGLPDLPRTVLGAWVSSFLSVGVRRCLVSLIQLALGTGVLPRFVIFGAMVILVPCRTRCSRLRELSHTKSRRGERPGTRNRARRPDRSLRSDLVRAPEQPAIVVASLDPLELEMPTAAASGPSPTSPRSAAGDTDRSRPRGAGVGVGSRPGRRTPRGGHQGEDALALLRGVAREAPPPRARADVAHVRHPGDPRRSVTRVIKRFSDIVLGLFGTRRSSLAAVPVVVRPRLFGNRGPLLYRQRRVGMGGTEFTILKFRTMRSSPELDLDRARRPQDRGGRPLAQADPPGRTPPGAERAAGRPLPGRPEARAAGLRGRAPAQKIPFYDVRHLVHPGLTGWAQVKFDYGASVADALEKLQYEFFYLRHQSLTLDARIVARTLRSVLGSREDELPVRAANVNRPRRQEPAPRKTSPTVRKPWPISEPDKAQPPEREEAPAQQGGPLRAPDQVEASLAGRRARHPTTSSRCSGWPSRGSTRPPQPVRSTRIRPPTANPVSCAGSTI